MKTKTGSRWQGSPQPRQVKPISTSAPAPAPAPSTVATTTVTSAEKPTVLSKQTPWGEFRKPQRLTRTSSAQRPSQSSLSSRPGNASSSSLSSANKTFGRTTRCQEGISAAATYQKEEKVGENEDDLDRIINDPEFQDIVAQIGLMSEEKKE